MAKLVGVAPLNDDSGKDAGARHIRGERAFHTCGHNHCIHLVTER
jgi:hypothetical protein